ncbi:MAG: Rieske (2Fe-2S) protein [Frankia sp.]
MSIQVLSRRSVGRGALVTVAAAAAGFIVARSSSMTTRKSLTAQANAGGVGGASGRRLAAVSDVPTGSGVIIADAQIVLTRDASGAIQGLSAVCTHQGCAVSSVEGTTIICPCHGSRFDTRTGRPTHGPATTPLPRVQVTVRDSVVFSG